MYLINFWFAMIQREHFSNKLNHLKTSKRIPTSSKLSALNPIIDENGIMQVGGRQQKAKFTYNSRHPITLDSKNPLTKVLIRSEHKRLLHGGSLMISSSLFVIITSLEVTELFAQLCDVQASCTKTKITVIRTTSSSTPHTRHGI